MKEIIYKASGIVIQDRKLLFVRASDNKHFSCPGGKLEFGESPEEALIREFKEELTAELQPFMIEYYAHFESPSGKYPGKFVDMTIFFIKEYDGVLKPSHEIEELKWITSKDVGQIKIGKIFEHNLLPLLKSKDLID